MDCAEQITKVEACRRAWADLPPGAYTARFIAEKANELGASPFCYDTDAHNAMRSIGVQVKAACPGAKGFYHKEQEL